MATADDQVQLIAEITETLRSADLKAWLFCGCGMDAHIGQQSRDHGDLEFWVEGREREREWVLEVLKARSFELLATQPPDESFEFERDGLRFSTAFFERMSDGSSKPAGRWSDWRLPPGSFAEEAGNLGQARVEVMSLERMLAMKMQYPALRNGKHWRPKDVTDIAAIEALIVGRIRERDQG